MANIHNLNKLWELVLTDVKLKIPHDDWEKCDTDFVKKCIAEFDRVDSAGMAFRYTGEGAEKVHVHFLWLSEFMDHVYQVLEGIHAYLDAMYEQNAEYDAYLESEFGV